MRIRKLKDSKADKRSREVMSVSYATTPFGLDGGGPIPMALPMGSPRVSDRIG